MATDFEELKQQKEELEKNLRSGSSLSNKKLNEAEDTISNLSSGILQRNEEISKLRKEIESKNRDLLSQESCISTLTESKRLAEEKSSDLRSELDSSKNLLRQKEQQISNLDEKIVQVNESLEAQILDKLAMEEDVEALTSGNCTLRLST